MNEKDVIKSSYLLLIIGSVLFLVVSLITKDLSFLLGYLMGYVIDLIIFYIIIKMCDLMLQMNQSTFLVILMNIFKLLIYAAGFILAVKSKYFHIVGVFFGYMVTKLSIYLEGIKHKGGDA